MAKFKVGDIVMINEYWEGNESYLGLIGEVVKIRCRFYMIKVKHCGYKFRLLVDPEEITKLGTTLPEIIFKRVPPYNCDYEIFVNSEYIGFWCSNSQRFVVDGDLLDYAKSKADIRKRLKKKTKRVEYWTLEE